MNILPAYVPPAESANAPEHAEWSPSSMGRLEKCNASVAFKDTEPRDPFAVAQANFGTEVHDWVKNCGGLYLSHWADEQRANAGACLTEWYKHVPTDAHKEVKIFSKTWPTKLFGTIDALWSEDNKCIDIADLKTGLRGVNALDNAQLLTYAVIVSENYPTAETFRLRIVQPLRYYYDGNVYSREQIAAFRERIRNAIELPQSYLAGSHCEFCPNRLDCSTLRNSLFGLIDEAKELGLWTPNGLTFLNDFCISNPSLPDCAK